MNRRDFIYLGAAGSALNLAVPSWVLAAQADTKLLGAGGLFYTQDSPGRWKGKEAGHLPQIALEKLDNKLKITITTDHVMKFHEHYIIKHQLLDQQFQYLDEKMFTDPQKDQDPVSTHELVDYRGEVIYAISYCNKHDLWLSMAKVG